MCELRMHLFANLVTNIKEIGQAHESYQSNLFDNQTDTHYKSLEICMIIKKLHKDHAI